MALPETLPEIALPNIREEGEDPKGWLYQVEQYFEFQRIETEDHVQLASFHLDGIALQWHRWITKFRGPMSWVEFSKALLRRFRPTDYEDPAKALSRLKQTTTVAPYQEAFENFNIKWMGYLRYSCKPQLFMINDVSEVEDEENIGDTQEHKPEDSLAEISFHAISGSINPQTLRLPGEIKNKEVMVLIDGGSTHNFIDQDLADRFWYSACPIVLGIQWLKTLGPVELDYEQLTTGFRLAGSSHKLRGLMGFKIAALKAHELIGIQGSRPESTRSYRQPYLQKAKIEKQVRELLQQGLIRQSHSPLSPSVLLRITTPAQAKWLSTLLGYDYKIKYKKGSSNKGADALSRRPECHFLATSHPYLLIWADNQNEVRTDPYYDDLPFSLPTKSQKNVMKPAGLLQPLPIPEQVWEDVSMDFVEGLANSNGFTAVMVVVDRLLKYAHFIPLRHPFTATTIAREFVSNIVRLHGIPSTVVVNCTMKQYLRCFADDKPKNWVEWLPWAEYSYNTSVHTATKMMPFQVVYGQPSPKLLPYVPGTTNIQAVNEYLRDRDELLRQLRANLLAAQHRMKIQADHHMRELEFEKGDLVFLKLQPYWQTSVATRVSNKLSPRFFGPYRILDKVGAVANRVELPPGSLIHNVFHVSLQRRCVGLAIDPSPMTIDASVLPLGPLQPECILDERVVQKGKYRPKMELLVKWLGRPREDATWETKWSIHSDSTVTWKNKNKEVVVLIECGKTHNFIDQALADHFGLVVEIDTPFKVVVGNREHVTCTGRMHNLSIVIQGYVVSTDFFMLPVAARPIVLGVQWLKTLGSVEMEYEQLTIWFRLAGSSHKLRGLKGFELAALKAHELIGIQGAALLLQITPVPTEIPPKRTPCPVIQQVLTQFATVFQNPTTLPAKRLQDHGIPLLPGSRPVSTRPYRQPYLQKAKIEKQVRKLLQQGLIRPSHSPFYSSVLLVKKSDGTWRVCIDYRSLNDVAVKDKYLIPIMDELLDELYGSRFYSKLDLRLGYHQIRETDERFAKHEAMFEKIMAELQKLITKQDQRIIDSTVTWKNKNKEVVVLIDGGSTHNFIDQALDDRFGLVVDTPLKVVVGNLEHVICTRRMRNLTIVIQGYVVSTDFFVLPVAACPIVLGVQWLKTIGPVEMDYEQLTMGFRLAGLSHKLRGLKGFELAALKAHELMGIQGAALLLQITPVPTEIPPKRTPFLVIQQVLTQFTTVFQNPTTLPPKRLQDHGIPLLLGSRTVSTRPYQQPYLQKAKI
uniref:Transposon Ty3-G Gag-Pol polyprotein n=1 Tax=Tanacetum cinerariifolium TaxID=118510 RepID=A0A6L2LRJ2_TANCI|nr:transposon Ty3-G Gag-Pol polyprotein [Tanacetum cinerariifolium]